MGNILSGSEIVELGIQIEKNGRDFYNSVYSNSKNEKAKAIFKFLSQEEEKHVKVFQGILAKTQKYEPQGLDSDEYYSYMTILASEHIFTQKDEGKDAAKTIKNDKEAVQRGIGFEQDSIVFYEGLKKIVPDYDQKIVKEIIIQEQSHLKQLIELKSKL